MSEAASQLYVGLAGSGVAAWVVMHEDEPGGPERLAAREQIPRWHVDAGDVTLLYRLYGEQLQAFIDVQRKQPLMCVPTQGCHIGFHGLPAMQDVPGTKESVRRQVIIRCSLMPALGAAKLGRTLAGQIACPRSRAS